MTSPAGWQEPGQTPGVGEYSVVLKGTPRGNRSVLTDIWPLLTGSLKGSRVEMLINRSLLNDGHIVQTMPCHLSE